MSVTFATALLRPLLGRRRSGEPARPASRCPHCREEAPARATGATASGDPQLCTRCGRLRAADGHPLRICPACGMLTEQGGTVHAGCAWQAARDEDARSAAEIARLEERTLDVLEQRFGATTTRSLQLYVDGIHEQVTGVRPSELVFPNLAEPGLAALPAGGLAVSLGLLATLEDEAQLGFVVARESFLARGGWPLRRFESAAAQRRRLIWWRGGLDDRLEEAVLLGLRVGYGPEIEREADREGLAALVRADYCPSAGLAALRALDAASPAGRGGRFVVTPERERWLEHAARGLGQPPTARLNREVYRRAVGGFAVFSETTRA